jgi:transposase
MSQSTMRKYPAEFKERAVKLAVESDQPIAQTARDLGVNENTLHTWIGKYHIPPDLVVKCQAIDNAEVIFSWIWLRNIVQTSYRNRKGRCEPLSLLTGCKF